MMNPVRGAIVARPEGYEWSSHRVNAGLRSDATITPHVEYLALGNGYAGLFEQALEPAMLAEIRKATNAGYPLGSEPGL